MKKLLIAIAASIAIISCGTDTDTMHIKGNIEGLRLGTLYFQRMNDSAIVNIDTIKFNGNGKFEFEVPLAEPEVFFLYLDKKDQNPLNDRIQFFGEPGEIEINTSREYFTVNASITGSESQKRYEDYLKTKQKFINKNLDLVEKRVKALMKNKTDKADSLDKLAATNTKRQYLYAINFCVNNGDTEATPFIALNDLSNTQVKFLDTIQTSLTEKVAKSKYGLMLDTYIKDYKAQLQKAKDSLN